MRQRSLHKSIIGINTHLQIEMLSIETLKSYHGNPRTWTQTQLEQLKTGIERNGFLVPIVVDENNRILGGHMRAEAARALGLKELPAVRIAVKSKKQARDILLRLNRNVGDWDWDILKAFDSDLLLDIGFSTDELAGAWDGLLETEDDHFDMEKELKKIKRPKTKLGDYYNLGPHRLICGDSRNAAIVRTLMGRTEASMLYIDPPFNIGLDYNKGVSGSQAYGGNTDDKKSTEQYRAFLRAILGNALAAGTRDLHCFLWCDENWTWLVQELYRELDITHRRLCCWVKGNFTLTPGIAFNKAMEIAVYGTVGKPYLAPGVTNLSEFLDKEVGSGGRQIDDLLDLFQIWACKRLHSSEYQHPTQKPTTLHEKPLRRCTKPGDIVLDLTAGSGSTLVACHQMKRRAFLCEIEPVFCDLIVERAKALGITHSLRRR